MISFQQEECHKAGKKKKREEFLTHLSGDGNAAGMRHGTALVAGVLLRAIKVQVPGPVCVVVPPAALELRQRTRDRVIFSSRNTASLFLAVHPASVGFSRGKTQVRRRARPRRWERDTECEGPTEHRNLVGARGPENSLAEAKMTDGPEVRHGRSRSLWFLVQRTLV